MSCREGSVRTPSIKHFECLIDSTRGAGAQVDVGIGKPDRDRSQGSVLVHLELAVVEGSVDHVVRPPPAATGRIPVADVWLHC